ncbi:MAG TPA: hypothetical protein PKJ41_14180, partial [Bryobacteraceae bacterium]|nr:hypothetical protein [Bryobacteraceae bacterium]
FTEKIERSGDVRQHQRQTTEPYPRLCAIGLLVNEHFKSLRGFRQLPTVEELVHVLQTRINFVTTARSDN